MTFGERLGNARRIAGLSHKELAAKIDISEPVIAQLEFGVRQPLLADIQRLAKALKVTSDYLLDPENGDL